MGDVDDGLVRSWIGRLLLCAWSANALDSSNTPFRSQGPFTDAIHRGFQSTTLQYKYRMIQREPLHCLMLLHNDRPKKAYENNKIFGSFFFEMDMNVCLPGHSAVALWIKIKVQNWLRSKLNFQRFFTFSQDFLMYLPKYLCMMLQMSGGPCKM